MSSTSTKFDSLKNSFSWSSRTWTLAFGRGSPSIKMARHSGASYQVIQHKPLDLKDFQDILWYVSVPEQYRYIYNIIYILYIIWKWYMIWFVNPMKNQTSTIRLPNFSSQDLEHTVLRQNSWCPPSFWSCFERSLLSTDRILTLFWKNLSPTKTH